MKLLYGVDDKVPAGPALLLALQHVLAVFVGIITPPLIVARALGCDMAETGLLVSMSLFTSGVNSYIQAHRFGPVGSGLLSIQGTTFVMVGLAIDTGKAGGLPLVFTLALIGAFVPMIVSRTFGVAQRFFPPVVTGSVVTLVGLSLISVGFNAFAGGLGASDFGSPSNLALGLFTMMVIVILNARGRGLFATASIAIGLSAGYLVAAALGRLDLSALSSAAWMHMPVPFRYPLRFDLARVLPWILAYLVVSIECLGSLTATASVSGEPVSGPTYVSRMQGGLLADGLGCAVTSTFGALPKTSFSQNVAVISLTRVASRQVGMIVGLMLMALGVFPKLAALVSIMPPPVLGGATVVMFALVAVAGLDIVQRDGFTPRNQLILAVSLALGLGVTMVPSATAQIHALQASTALERFAIDLLQALVESGLTVGTVTAVALNLLLPPDEAGEKGSDAEPHDHVG